MNNKMNTYFTPEDEQELRKLRKRERNRLRTAVIIFAMAVPFGILAVLFNISEFIGEFFPQTRLANTTTQPTTTVSSGHTYHTNTDVNNACKQYIAEHDLESFIASRCEPESAQPGLYHTDNNENNYCALYHKLGEQYEFEISNCLPNPAQPLQPATTTTTTIDSAQLTACKQDDTHSENCYWLLHAAAECAQLATAGDWLQHHYNGCPAPPATSGWRYHRNPRTNRRCERLANAGEYQLMQAQGCTSNPEQSIIPATTN